MSEVKIAPIPDLGQRTDEITIYAGPMLGGIRRAVRGSGRMRGRFGLALDSRRRVQAAH